MPDLNQLRLTPSPTNAISAQHPLFIFKLVTKVSALPMSLPSFSSSFPLLQTYLISAQAIRFSLPPWLSCHCPTG